jgi:tetrahydromethanopterin S-methyltransferase subunit G
MEDRMTEENLGSVFELANTRVVHLNAMVQGISAGLVIGLAIFVATNWLILAGGHTGPEGQPIVGPHLSLLGQFFFGYQVTFIGSLIGFAYGAVIGFIGGYSLSTMYNWMVRRREGKR